MKKRALLIGCNYPGTENQLNGCVNDVILMRDIIGKYFGFTDPLNCRMLTDNSCTTKNIIERLNWLVEDVHIGDELFLHYSGHGTQVPCQNDYELSIEPDGMVEALVPKDINWRDKMVTDKMLGKILNNIPDGVNCTVVMDCCHSGDNLREVFNLACQPVPSPVKSRFINCPPDIMNRAYGLDLQTKSVLGTISYEEQKPILISGCKSNQTSADAWIQKAKKYHGALTYTLAEVLSQMGYEAPGDTLVQAINKALKAGGYDQEPQLDCKKALASKLFLK